ncbi:hypothetical protein B0J14DRAFT_287743 [Halenospora varia]|nr:hypothetical protein B0J14DRAFT_287743 [Halenospora varia]
MLQGDGTLMSTIELFHPHTEQEAGNDKASLNPWFTSLWTLQEICIRPDMLICNATWEFLAVRQNVTVTFDELVALYQANFKADEKRSRYPDARKPRAVTELIHLLEYTGLSSLLTMSRPTILILGNQRQCLEGRAEAIMAVLDATEWFSTSLEDPAEDDLVLNLYPVDFVNEIRAKIGPATFFSSESIEPYFVKSLEQFSSLEEVHAFGSMLPFGPGLPKFFHDIKSDPNMSPDDSMNTWTVDPTGCVRINEVVIISSSREVAPADVMSSFIFGPVIGASNDRIVMPQEDVDLHSWVRAYRPSLPNYAIGIYISPTGSLGILLKEIVPGVLVKIGSYWENAAASHDIPKSKVVNWVVV